MHETSTATIEEDVSGKISRQFKLTEKTIGGRLAQFRRQLKGKGFAIDEDERGYTPMTKEEARTLAGENDDHDTVRMLKREAEKARGARRRERAKTEPIVAARLQLEEAKRRLKRAIEREIDNQDTIDRNQREVIELRATIERLKREAKDHGTARTRRSHAQPCGGRGAGGVDDSAMG